MITLSYAAGILIGGGCIALGWSLHAAWLRRRVTVHDTGDGTTVVQLGRAVAGVWRSRGLAVFHAAAMRRQIGGHR